LGNEAAIGKLCLMLKFKGTNQHFLYEQNPCYPKMQRELSIYPSLTINALNASLLENNLFLLNPLHTFSENQINNVQEFIIDIFFIKFNASVLRTNTCGRQPDSGLSYNS
jgi:hypothetical protein